MAVIPLHAPKTESPSFALENAEAPGVPEGLRKALRQLASGVSVITTGKAPNRTGFTATSVSSLSIDPARIIVSVNRNSSSYHALRASGIFAVNFLASYQVHLANQFAGRDGIKGEARFAGADWEVLESGASVLAGALASIDCAVEEFIERHSHAIVIGRVLATRSADSGGALLYWRGKYDPFEATDLSAID
jgi:flavin reductase (DIM6/NTAB) family NADH-FMN oxidoreductase RutF